MVCLHIILLWLWLQWTADQPVLPRRLCALQPRPPRRQENARRIKYGCESFGYSSKHTDFLSCLSNWFENNWRLDLFIRVSLHKQCLLNIKLCWNGLPIFWYRSALSARSILDCVGAAPLQTDRCAALRCTRRCESFCGGRCGAAGPAWQAAPPPAASHGGRQPDVLQPGPLLPPPSSAQLNTATSLPKNRSKTQFTNFVKIRSIIGRCLRISNYVPKKCPSDGTQFTKIYPV